VNSSRRIDGTSIVPDPTPLVQLRLMVLRGKL
jgi:hypothetical protein